MKGLSPVWWAHLRCIDKDDDDAQLPREEKQKEKILSPFYKNSDPQHQESKNY